MSGERQSPILDVYDQFIATRPASAPRSGAEFEYDFGIWADQQGYDSTDFD